MDKCWSSFLWTPFIHRRSLRCQYTDRQPCYKTRKEVGFPTADSATKLLLSKVDGTYFATSAKCNHYGVPLVKGVLNGSRIICMAHGAAFNAKTG